MNVVLLNGRLTRDPELRYTQTNQAVTNFTIAVDRNLSSEKIQEYQNKNLPTADYIRVTVWGKQAENVAQYLFKGSPVLVNGRIQTGSYKNEQNQDVYTTDVVASNIEFLETKQQADARRSAMPQGQANQANGQQGGYNQAPQQNRAYQQGQQYGYNQAPQANYQQQMPQQNQSQQQGGYNQNQAPQQNQNYQQAPVQQQQPAYNQSNDFVQQNDDFVEIEDDGRIPF